MSFKQHSAVWAIFAILIAFVLIGFAFRDSLGIFGSHEMITQFVEQFGAAGPLVLIALITAEVIIAPLPGGFLPVVSGVIFGIFPGIAYSWAGNMLGSIIAFLIARKFGERAVAFFIPSFKRERYHRQLEKHTAPLLTMYAVPVVPVDVLSFALGLSLIRMKKFLAVVAFAFVIRMTLWNLFGGALAGLLFV